MSKQGKQALLDAVAGGKGFLGIHAATDTFRGDPNIDPYTRMIGAEFTGHGEQQKTRMTVIDPQFPGLKELGDGFEMFEEWYAMKNFAPDLHVLLVTETKQMKGRDYERPPFPGTWARKHGDGRVVYTSMGHREDVWTNPVFEQTIVGALNWVTGLAQAEVPTNFDQVTPRANQMTN